MLNIKYTIRKSSIAKTVAQGEFYVQETNFRCYPAEFPFLGKPVCMPGIWGSPEGILE